MRLLASAKRRLRRATSSAEASALASAAVAASAICRYFCSNVSTWRARSSAHRRPSASWASRAAAAFASDCSTAAVCRSNSLRSVCAAEATDWSYAPLLADKAMASPSRSARSAAAPLFSSAFCSDSRSIAASLLAIVRRASSSESAIVRCSSRRRSASELC